MTPFQFAKAECSNFIPETSGCKGIIIHNDGSTTKALHIPTKCLLDTPIKRCSFFEECIAPLVKSFGPPYEKQNTVARHKDAIDAVRSYRKACKLPCGDERPCPTCGRPMEPRQQYCELCSENRKRESKRLWARDRRSNVEKQARPNA